MRTILSLGIATLLAGCASQASPMRPTSRLIGPDAAVMVPPAALAAPLPGEDAKALLQQCRAQYGRETDKIEPLQLFAKRVTRVQK